MSWGHDAGDDGRSVRRGPGRCAARRWRVLCLADVAVFATLAIAAWAVGVSSRERALYSWVVAADAARPRDRFVWIIALRELPDRQLGAPEPVPHARADDRLTRWSVPGAILAQPIVEDGGPGG
jgi:hypothetical protein